IRQARGARWTAAANARPPAMARIKRQRSGGSEIPRHTYAPDTTTWNRASQSARAIVTAAATAALTATSRATGRAERGRAATGGDDRVSGAVAMAGSRAASIANGGARPAIIERRGDGMASILNLSDVWRVIKEMD